MRTYSNASGLGTYLYADNYARGQWIAQAVSDLLSVDEKVTNKV